MIKSPKLIKYTISAVLLAGVLTACGKDKESKEIEIVTDSPKVEVSSKPDIEEGNVDVTEPNDLLIQHDYTGLMVTPEENNHRPVAVMINNIKEAMPQSGIGQADVVYEMLVEGGITRLLAIYTDYDDLAKIGPVRSARMAYGIVTAEYDAIYIHYGGSEDGYEKIADYNLDDIDGMNDSLVFYRDSSRVAPHNAYINSDTLASGITSYGYRSTKAATSDAKFHFYENDTELAKGESAITVSTPFSTYQKPYFTYNETTKTYDRFQYNSAQIDDLTGNQLSYKNIIIQVVTEYALDSAGHQAMDMVGSGTGYYVTNGKYVKIIWKKTSETAITRYYLEDGTELSLNPGKTWIAIFPMNQESNINIQ